MHTYRLLPEDINHCLLLPTINERKSFYGRPVPKFLSSYKKIVCNIFPRGGKSYIGLDCIQKLRRNKPNSRICIVVPSDVIRKEWIKHLDNIGISDIYIYSINSYISDETIVKKYDLLIVDEVHKVLGDSAGFSTVIPSTTCTYFLGLSATLTPQMLSKLESYGVVFCYQIPLETGYLLDVIPEFISYNIPIELTAQEKRDYLDINKDYQYYYDQFFKFDEENTIDTIKNCLNKYPFTYNGKLCDSKQLVNIIAKKLNKKAGIVIGDASHFMTAMRERSELLYKAKNKMVAFYELIEHLDANEKKVIFTYKTDYANQIADNLPSSKTYHSKMKVKEKRLVMEEYNRNEFANIVTCKSLEEGFTSPVKIAIRMFFDSTTGKTTQTLGRLLMKNEDNPDEVATVYTFYVDDFMHGSQTIYSQEKKWLKYSQKSLMFVKWVKSINDIPFKNGNK